MSVSSPKPSAISDHILQLPTSPVWQVATASISECVMCNLIPKRGTGLIILLSARHSSIEQKAQEVMLFPCPDNPGLLFIVTALSTPCAVILNGVGGFSTSFSRKSTPQEISDIRSEASMSECILALLAELRLLASCCPRRTAGPQGARPNSVWGHMKGKMLCQTRVSTPLQSEHRAEGTCYLPLQLFKTRTDSTLASQNKLWGWGNSCNNGIQN